MGLSIVAESKLTPLLSLAKVNYTFFDRVLGNKPSFGYKSVGLGSFSSQVDAAPNVALAGKVETKNDLLLSVRLPRSGDYVDIADLLDFTAKTTAATPTRSGRIRLATPSAFDLSSRVHRKRFLEVVSELPNFDLAEEGAAGDSINLNVTLPKAKGTVSVRPLFAFAEKVAEPRATASMKAELHFDELP